MTGRVVATSVRHREISGQEVLCEGISFMWKQLVTGWVSELRRERRRTIHRSWRTQ